MKVQWLGHSSFRLIGSKVIVTDPYGGIGIDYPEIAAELVTVSHGHSDHSAVEAVKGDPAVVDDAGKHEFSGIRITGYPTYHDAQQGKLRGGNIVYLIEIDGMRVAHLGDLGGHPGADVMTALRGADVLLVPVGGHYTLDGEQAAKLVKELNPRVAIPMHYRVPGLTVDVAGPEQFLSAVPDYTLVEGAEAVITHNSPRVLVFSKRL